MPFFGRVLMHKTARDGRTGTFPPSTVTLRCKVDEIAVDSIQLMAVNVSEMIHSDVLLHQSKRKIASFIQMKKQRKLAWCDKTERTSV